MSGSRVVALAKVLEGLGLVLVLVGVLMSIRLGLDDESLASMRWEMRGLLAGGGLFLAGWVLERLAARR